MARLTKYDPVRECYVIVPDSTTNHIQRLGELEDYENPYCKFCGQRLKWGE